MTRSDLRVDVVSPHQDDAAYSINGAMAGLAAAGARQRIVNIFTVSNFVPSPSSYSTIEVSRIRASEDRSFAAMFEPPLEIVDLGRLDAPIRGHRQDELRASGPLIGSALEEAGRVAQLLRRLWCDDPPTLVITPLALGGHVDHLIARHAALEAWTGPFAFYEDIPHAALVDAAALLEITEEITDQIGKPLEPFLVGGGGLRQTAEKFRVASLYRSQECEFLLDGIHAHSKQIGGRERLWTEPETVGVLESWLVMQR